MSFPLPVFSVGVPHQQEKVFWMECPALAGPKKIYLLFEDLNGQAKVEDPDLAGLDTPDFLLLSVGALHQQMRVR